MSLWTLIIDREAPRGCHCRTSSSVLTAPLGSSTVLEQLARQVRSLPDANATVLVMPGFEPPDGYGQRLQNATGSPVRVVLPAEFQQLAEESEPADYALVLDAARWPAQGMEFDDALHGGIEYLAATHLIAIRGPAHGIREKVEHDPSGCIKRVQRLYDRVAWPEVGADGAYASVVPMCTLAETHFTDLGELRSRLAARGVLSRDIPKAVNLIDLAQVEGLLTANDRALSRARLADTNGIFMRHSDTVLVARDCEIDPSARLVGRVVLHPGVRIGAGVTVVGPTVIGSGSHLGADCTVVQSVLPGGTLVAANSTLRHCVGCGSCDAVRPAGFPSSCKGIQPACLTAIAINENSGHDEEILPQTHDRRIQQWIKRGFDLALSGIGLLALSPLLVVVAALVKITSPGPLFFVHRREQRDGKEFGCLKFRTMVPDAHARQKDLYAKSEVDGPQFKLAEDPRVTPVGRWLRRTNIDELPQLLNVFLGHMSLVGPRPSPFRENQICVPWRRARLSVRPGITGLWQLCRGARTGVTGFDEWIYYDLAYVRHFSLWLDLKILCGTVVTLGGRWPVPVSRLLGKRRSEGLGPVEAAAA